MCTGFPESICLPQVAHTCLAPLTTDVGELHEGAAYCLYALGSFDEVKLYTNAIIDNVSFEAGLFAQDLLLRSLRGSGELGYSDAITHGIDVLRQLKIDLPAIATPTHALLYLVTP